MASEVIERKIVQIGLDKKELVSGLQKAVKDVESFQSKLSHIKTDSLEKISSAVENVKTHFSNLLDKIPIVSTLKDHIAGLGKSSGEAAISMSELNQNGNFSTIISGASQASQGMEQLGNATSGTSKVFSILEGAASVALGNIATKAITTAGSLLNSWTLAPVIQGYQEYERELDSTRILVSALGESESDHITAVMRDLEQYAKTTRYSSQEMNAATAQFVNAGIGLDESATALKGWGNLAASASASTADFNRTLQTSVEQALQMGYMNLQNWRQIQNANMATKKFKDTIIQTAIAQGDVTGEIQAAIDAYGELNDEAVNYLFNDRLTKGQWFNNDVLMAALTEYANDPELVEQAASLYTFKEALEATEEAVSDAWSKFWVEVVGKGDDAVAIWTPVGEIMQNVVSFIPNAMTEIAKVFNQLDGRTHVIRTFQAVWEKLTLVVNSFKETFKNVFPNSQNTIGQGIIHLFDRLTEKITGSELSVNSLNQIFTAFWRVLKIGVSIVGGLAKVLDLLIPNNLIEMVVNLVSVYGRFFNMLYDGFTVLKEYVNTSPLLAMFQSLRDTARDFWDFFATLLNAIIEKTFTVQSSLVKLGAHTIGFFGNTIKRLLGFGEAVDEAGKPVETFSQKFIGFQNELGASYRLFHDVYGQTHSLTEAFKQFGDALLNMQHGGLFTKLFGKIITDATRIKGIWVETAHGAQMVNQEYHLSYEIISKITKSWELFKSKQDEVFKAFEDMRTSYDNFSPMERMYILAQKIYNIFDGKLFTDKLLDFTKWFTGIDGTIDKTTGKLNRAYSASAFLGKGLTLVKKAIQALFGILKSVVDFGGTILTGMVNHWEALLAPIVLVGTAIQSLVKIFSAVWDEANRVYDIMGRIKSVASEILLTGLGLFGEFLFGPTAYADEIGGVSETMEENIPITERLGREIDALGQKIADSTAKFKMHTDAIVKSKSPIKALTSTFKSLGSKIGSFFNFKDFIAGLKGVGDESNVLKTKMGQLGNFLNKHLRIDFQAMVDGFKKQSKSFGDTMGTIGEWIKDIIANLDFSSKAAFIKSVFVGIGETFKRVGKTIGGVFGAIGEGFANLGKWILNFAESKALSNIIQAGTLLAFIRLLNKLSKAVESFGKIPKGISDVLVAFGGVLKSYQKEIKAKSIREIATALLLMSGALFIIATIPTSKLLTSIMALATMATILVGAYTTIKFAQKKFGSSTSGGIMGNVVDALGLGEVNKLAKKIGAATMLVSLGATLLLVIKPFKEIAAMDWAEILQGVIGMGLVLTEIVGATWLSGLSKADMGTALTIYALGKVLKACVDLFKPLAAIDGKEYATGLLKIAGIAAVIAGAIALMSGKFEFFKTGLVNVEWGSVNFGTAGTIVALSNAIGNIIDSFTVINKYSTDQIDNAMKVIEKIAASIRNAIMLMAGTLTLGTDGTTGTFKLGNKTIFSGLPQLGFKAATGATKWSLAATIIAFTEAIKMIIDTFDDINKLKPSQIDRGVKTINRIARSLTLAIAAMSFTLSLDLGVGFKGKIGTSGMTWAQSLGIAVFVAGLLFLTDQLDDLAKIKPKRLEAATNAIKTISDQLGILFMAMNIAALGQNYMGTDMATMALTIGMMGSVVIALKVVGDELIKFANLDGEQINKGRSALIAVGGTITVMTAVLAGISILNSKVGNIAGVIETLAMLGSVVLSLKVVGDMFMQFSSLDATALATAQQALSAISLCILGMVTVLGVMGLVAGGAATLDPLMLAGAAEVLLLLAGAVMSIKVVGDEFIKLGGMSAGQIANARVALEAITEAIEGMVGVLALFGMASGAVGTIAPGVLVAIPETMDGARKAADSIAKLAPSFVTLGSMDTGSISRAKSAMKFIQNALSEMVKTGFWESWFKNWSAVKDKMSATNTAAKAMKNAGSALEEIGAADVSVYQKGNSNLSVIKKGIKDMLDSANEVNNTAIGDTALENAKLLRKIMRAIGDAFDEAATITATDTSGLKSAVSNLASSAAEGLTSPEVAQRYNAGGQYIIQSTRSGVDIMAPYMGEGGALAAGSFVSGVQSGQIGADSAGRLLTQMAQSGASSSDLAAVAKTLGGSYTNGIFSFRGQSFNVGSGLTKQANSGAGSGVGALSSTGGKAGSNFAGGVRGSSGTAKSAGSAVLAAARTALSLTTGFNTAGIAIVNAFAGGIRGAIGVVKSAASSVMQAVKNLMPHSPAPEGPFSGKGWTEVGSSGRAIAEEWVGGIVAGFDEDRTLESALSQVQETITAISDYTYDNLTLTPTITPVVDMSGIDAANLQFAKFKMTNPGVIETKVSYDTLNQASLQASKTKHNIDTVVEGMNILNRKLGDIAGINSAQTDEIKKGQFPTFEIDGYKVNKQLAPGMQAAQTAYINQVNRRGGILPTL